MTKLYRRAAVLAIALGTSVAAGCTSGRTVSSREHPSPSRVTHRARSTTVPPPSSASSSKPRPSHHHRRSKTSTAPPTHSTVPNHPTSSIRPSGTGPVIVIDPGHSVSVHAIDPATGLDVSDYENEPEMHDVFAVAEIVRSELLAAGYRVIMTKPTVDTPTSLGRRAEIANAAHAALALSIHDQAGANGGIGFDAGNNIVYYQSVGTYRETPAGKKVYFTDAHVAAESKACGENFQQARAKAQHVPVELLGNTGYNLGGRGLPAGNIWMVQLLSHVPWIYNEAGGNSAGMVGLDRADERTYAAGLVAGVEACVPAG